MALPINTKAPLFTLKSATKDGLQDIALAKNFGSKERLYFFFH